MGKVSATGSPTLHPTPISGVSVLADPLAILPVPSVNTADLGTITVSGSTSRTLNPGVYDRITVSGSGKLTLNPGIYVIKGGGLTVSGSAALMGSGVLIYNAGSNYPALGGNFGGITLSNSGSLNVSPATTGAYAGLTIFQARDNIRHRAQRSACPT